MVIVIRYIDIPAFINRDSVGSIKTSSQPFTIRKIRFSRTCKRINNAVWGNLPN